ncbi:MAG: DUF4465 domain-containing protein [Bacteroidales bacterium]
MKKLYLALSLLLVAFCFQPTQVKANQTNESYSSQESTPISGNFTIGSSADATYSTFTSAIQSLVEGINGPVVFKVEAGTYNESIEIPKIEGVSESNTITFMAKEGEEVKLQNTKLYAAPLVSLNNASRIIIDGFKLEVDKSGKEALLLIKNKSSYNIIRNCSFKAPLFTTYSQKLNLILTEAENAENMNNNFNTFEGNTFDGGYNGLALEGPLYPTLPQQEGDCVKNNTFTNQGSKCIYLRAIKNIIIEGNKLNNNTTTKGSFEAIDGSRISGNVKVFNNVVQLDLANDATGIEFRPLEGFQESLIFNNMISIKSKGDAYGFILDDGCKNLGVYFNTVQIAGTPKYSSAIIVEGRSNDIPESVSIKNNIFVNKASQYLVRIKRAEFVSKVSVDNNFLSTEGAVAKIADEEFADLSSWQGKMGAANSKTGSVAFTSDRDLHIFPDASMTFALPISTILKDIDNNPRNASNPYVGAHEPQGVAETVPVFSAAYPKIQFLSSQKINVFLKADKSGYAYLQVLEAAEAAPSVSALIENGSKVSLTANEEVKFKIQDLKSEVKYILYAITKDAKGNCSTDIKSIDFTSLAAEFKVADMEDLTLEANSFWNGSDESGFFNSGSAKFINTYNTAYKSWDGFAYSNYTDKNTPGLANQYAAYVSHSDIENNKYAVAYMNTYTNSNPTIEFTNTTQPQNADGILVANSAYTYHSMKDGDDFSKKFGGADGNDKDFLLLDIYGIDKDGEEVGPVHFYLADYRFDDNSKDYIIDDWTYVDLTSLGKVKKLVFKLSSSDTGEYGMNTPAYFCVDNVNGEAFSMKLEDMPNLTVNLNESTQLNAIARGGYAPFIYKWEDNATLSASDIKNPKATPTRTTTYKVTVIDARGNSAEGSVIVNVLQGALVADFEDLTLGTDSHWNGVQKEGDENGSVNYFHSGTCEFYNFYSEQYKTWSGFAYANHTSSTYSQLSDQFNAITGKAHSGSNYAIFYGFNDDPSNKISFTNTVDGEKVSGMYVTNSAWAATSMENGDQYSKKFGGEDGNDPDFFKIVAKGIDKDGKETAIVEFFLADFRSEDNSDDYIVKEWKWFDLSSLGTVKEVQFHLESSDNGDYGMNTPGYFCFDDFNGEVSVGVESINPAEVLSFGPNPADTYINFDSSDDGILMIYSLDGKKLMEQDTYKGRNRINIDFLQRGTYVLSLRSKDFVKTSKLLKR